MKKRLRNLTLKPAEIERKCHELFNVELKVCHILLNNSFTGNNSHTTVFKNDHNEIFALCTCEEPLLLADIKAIIKQMGMKADKFLPPNGDSGYFIKYAKLSHSTVFPGSKYSSDQDLSFYESFAPYSPALVKIARVNGEIRDFDISWNKWTSAVNFSYYKVKVS